MKSLLFNSAMSRAWIEGRKHMTRRLQGLDVVNKEPDAWMQIGWRILNGRQGMAFKSETGTGIAYPRFTPGELFYGKETWGAPQWADARRPRDLDPRCPLYYHADKSHGKLVRWNDEDEELGKTRVSIHMPEWASRIRGRITGVKCERLQDISEEDAKSEGVIPEFEVDLGTFMNKRADIAAGSTHYLGFKHVWQSIHGPESWAANPWLFCYSMEKI